MREGDVALADLIQFDRQMKRRPVLVLREMPRHRDVLVCGISTRLHQYVDHFDELISPDDEDFGSSGLLAKSLVRLGFLSVLPRSRLVGSIGAISRERHRRLLTALGRYLVADPA